MKQSDALQLVEPGTLIRPAVIGRLVRLALGLLCLFVLGELIYYRPWTTHDPVSTLDNRFLVLLAPLCILNYVVNIGFAQSWGRRPRVISLVVLAAFAGVAYLVAGSASNAVFGIPHNLWLAYFYGHLGFSFVLSAVIATPGCEMRSIPELLGRARGLPAQEHHCPAAFITRIDAWEQRRFHSA